MKAKLISIYLLFIFTLLMNANKTVLGQVGGNSLWLDGVNDYMIVPDSPSLDITGNQITVEVWIMIKGGSSYKTIVRKTIGWSQGGFFFRVDPEGTLFFWAFVTTGGSASGTTVLDTDIWYHVAATYDGSSVRLFVNGVLDGIGSGSGNIKTCSKELNVGKSENPGAEFFGGVFDELQISNTVRYTSDFEPPTERLLTDENTAALYHFDETEGETAYDVSANNNNGALYNGAYFGPVLTIGDAFTRIITGDIVNDDGWSCACCWGDYNNDDFIDLFVSNHNNQNNLLYSNNGDGTFSKITTGIIVNDGGNSRGCSWGDYDNDGYLDLFVANQNQNNYLYKNNGDGTFSKITTGDIVNDGGNSFVGSWGDYNNDGYLDLLVANWDNENNCLYANNGDGTFTKITTGIVVNHGGLSKGCSWGDYDNDGFLDLYVTNSSWPNPGTPNFLYHNNGDGTFTHITTGNVVTDDTHSSGSSWQDYDNDGDLDLFVSNDAQNNALYQNNGDGTFNKITTGPIVTDGGSSFGSCWADFNKDGDLDLFVANWNAQNNFLYENNGDGTFTRVITSSVVTDDGNSLGSSWCDIDNDGDLDLFVANGNNGNNFLYLNNGNSNNWINIKCIGKLSNTSAIGVKVSVKATIGGVEVWQLSEISGLTGGGNGGENSLNAEFGLGDATVIDSIKIHWSWGNVKVLTDVPVNQFLIIYEDTEPGVFSVYPQNGPNTGTISVTIRGWGFHPGASARLVRSGYQDIVGTETNVVDSSIIYTNFDLTNRQLGSWDVVVVNPGGQTMTLPDGFTIDEGYVNLWVDIVGREQMRVGRQQTYSLRVGNSGNVDIDRAVIISTASPNVDLYANLPHAWYVSPIESNNPDSCIGFILYDLTPESMHSIQLELTANSGGNISLYCKGWILQKESNSFIGNQVHGIDIILNQALINTYTNKLTHHQILRLWPPDPPPEGSIIFQDDPTFPFRVGHEGIVCYDDNDNVYVWENMGKWGDDPGGTRLTPWIDFCKRSYPNWPDLSPGWQDHCDLSLSDIQKRNLRIWLWNNSRQNDNSIPFDFNMKCSDAVAKAFRDELGIDLPGHNIWDSPVENWKKLTDKPWWGSPWGKVYEISRQFMPEVSVLLYEWYWMQIAWDRIFRAVQSWDPNEKVGPMGFGKAISVSLDQILQYIVYFENVESATAAAEEVLIKDTLDVDLDWSTFSLGEIQFGDTTLIIPESSQNYSTTVILNDTTHVEINCTFNQSTGEVQWYLKGTDPRDGSFMGFLPPNVNPPEGEGHMSFTVYPKQYLASGTQITNRASITFDVNPPIMTNEVLNTIDAEKPVSGITAYSPSPKPPQFEINWTGTDEPNGSGVKSYNVFFSEDGGPYKPWLRDTTATSGIFSVSQCRSIAFYSTARDSVGHIEPMPMEPDTILPPMAIYQFGDMGWYLHSLPVAVENDSIEYLFPNSLGAMGWDAYNQKYYDADKMFVGEGYWLAIPQPDSIGTIGTPVQSFARHFHQGWHLIGSVKEMVDFSNPNDNPDGAVLGAFGWDAQSRSYYETDTLLTNRGYWIAVLEECDLTVGGEMGHGKLTKSKASVIEFYQKYGHQPPPPPSYIFGDGELVEVPLTYELFQNYPNPFNAQTVIKYQLPEAGKVSLKIYNILGQEVKTLIDEEKQAGYHKVIWDGRNNQGSFVATGLYIYKIKAGEFESRKKMLILK